VRVVCVVVPHLQVEMERLYAPELRGRPVVVGGAPEDRREVLDCSDEAMACGVRPGMSLREALLRCAEAAFVEAHPSRYAEVTDAMVLALLQISELVEPAKPGVIYVEIGDAPAAMEKAAARTIAAAVEEASGLAVRIGVADGKFQAYVAAMASGK
jgi:DNA polymerase IV